MKSITTTSVNDALGTDVNDDLGTDKAGRDHGARTRGRLGALEQKTDRHFELLIGRMDRQFLWLIGVLLTSLAGLVTSLLTLLIRQ